MNRRDRELLDKQLRGHTPLQKHGMVIFTVVAVFFAGVTVGGTLFSHQSDLTRTTSSNETEISFLDNISRTATDSK